MEATLTIYNVDRQPLPEELIWWCGQSAAPSSSRKVILFAYNVLAANVKSCCFRQSGYEDGGGPRRYLTALPCFTDGSSSAGATRCTWCRSVNTFPSRDFSHS